ncbi:MAG: ribulose phosphate epimerase [Epulopiscium sp. Nele67-Bin002]|nr:MAG: ribulose phosphate epimerase [Epulopiscium sp. Nele67-Bin002]OON92767.1 MAG: ribulose-phosphate 3-epimerase [Epulopiscium sp. Nele67-Bin001]
MDLAPSLLSANMLNLENELNALVKSNVKYLHIDVMDGSFVPNMGFGPTMVKDIKNNFELILDCHLMTNKPENLVELFATAGADIITVHAEATQHIYHVIQKIKSLGCKAGIAINPGTPVTYIAPLLNIVDLVLVMTINPGISAQEFIADTIDKVSELVYIRTSKNYNFLIEVDGSVSNKTIGFCKGIDIAVAGRYIFNGDIAMNVQSLIKESELAWK